MKLHWMRRLAPLLFVLASAPLLAADFPPNAVPEPLKAWVPWVLDDVTVTQVTAVAELRNADPHASAYDLYRAGLRIGRDHVASTVNTLVLAYAGAALPLLLMFTQGGPSKPARTLVGI